MSHSQTHSPLPDHLSVFLFCSFSWSISKTLMPFSKSTLPFQCPLPHYLTLVKYIAPLLKSSKLYTYLYYQTFFKFQADVFTQKVFAALKPVNLFIESWFERLLSGTWKSLETRLIESIIRRKPDHGEDNVTYAALAKTIREEMEMIGSEK